MAITSFLNKPTGEKAKTELAPETKSGITSFAQTSQPSKVVAVPAEKKVVIPETKVPLVLPTTGKIPGLSDGSEKLLLPTPDTTIPGMVKGIPEAPVKPFFDESLKNIEDNVTYKNNTPFPDSVDKRVRDIGAGFAGQMLQLPKGIKNIGNVIAGSPLTSGDWTDRLAATGQKYSEVTDKVLYGDQPKPFSAKLASGAGNMASFFVPGTGVGKLGMAGEYLLANSVRFAKYAPAVAALLGQGTMATLESSQEAGQIYDDVLQKTNDPVKAQEETEKGFLGNIILAAITNKFSGYFEALEPGVKNVLKRVVGAFVSEGGQESGQQIIQNIASGASNIFDGVAESGIIGGILGSGATVGSANVFNADGTVNKEKVIEVLNQTQAEPIDLTTPTSDVAPSENQSGVEQPAPEFTNEEIQQFIDQNKQDENNNFTASEEGQITADIADQLKGITDTYNQFTEEQKNSSLGKDVEAIVNDLQKQLDEVQTQYVQKRHPEIVEKVKKQKEAKRIVTEEIKGEKIEIDGEKFNRPDAVVTKTQVKKLLKDLDTETIQMEVVDRGGKKALYYKDAGRNLEFNLLTSALGLVNNDNLKVGDKVSVSEDDLQTKGASSKTAFRAVNEEGKVLASKPESKKKTEENTSEKKIPRGPVQIDKFEKRDTTGIAKPEDFKIYKKTAELIKKYATRVAEGNVQRGALGTFNPNNLTIRTKGLNSFAVAVHEITHSLDMLNFVTKGTMNVTGYSVTGNPIYDKNTAEYRKALNQVYMENYGTATASEKLGTRMKEGYAMLLERYTEAPKYTEERYPFAVKEFLQPGGKYYRPVVGEILKDLKQITGEYQTLSASEKILARVTHDNNITGKESFLNTEEMVRTQVADEVYPIQKFARIAGVEGSQQDPSLFIRHYSRTGSYFANNVEGENGYWSYKNGEFQKKFDENWGSLLKTLEEKNLRKEFDAFLVARRVHFDYKNLNELTENIKKLEDIQKRIEAEIDYGGMDKMEGTSILLDVKEKLQTAREERDNLKKVLYADQMAENVAAEAYTEQKDKFVEEEQLFDKLTKADLDLMVSEDVGLITQDEYERLSSQEGYASFKREFYNEIVGDENSPGKGSKNGKASSLKQRHGSSRTIISPLLSGIKNHSEILQKSMKQVVYNKMAALAKTGNVDNFMEVVPLTKSVDEKTGMITYPQDNKSDIIMGRVNGRRVPVQTDAFIKNTLDNLVDFQSIGNVEKVFQGFNRMFSKGTTSSFPPFAVTNMVLDQFTAWSNTKHNYKPFITPAKMLLNKMMDKKGEDAKYFKEYLVLVGDRLAIGKAQEMSANEMAEYIAGERNGVLKVLDKINKGLDFLAAPAQFTESLTRGSEYVNARKAGKSQVEAMEQAADLTGSFARIGKLGGKIKNVGMGKTLVKSVPYFNAGIQITDKLYRQLKTKDGAKKLALVTGVITAANVASMALLIANGTDDQKEIFKDLSGSDLSKYLFLPSPDGETLIKVRLPDFFLMPSAVINMMIAQQYLDVKYTVNDFVDAMTAFIPTPLNITKPKEALMGTIPEAIKPALKVMTNTEDFPRIHPLEGQGQQQKPSEDRFTPSTSALSKYLGGFTGREIGLSPIQLDTLITGYFGRVSGYATGKPGVYNASSTFTQKQYFEGGRRMQQYYTTKKAVDEDYTANKISDKKKKDLPLTDEEKRIDTVHKIVHGYTPNDVPGVKEERVKGVEDLLDDYKEAQTKGDKLKMTILIKKINDRMQEVNKFEYE